MSIMFSHFEKDLDISKAYSGLCLLNVMFYLIQRYPLITGSENIPKVSLAT